MSLAEFFPVYPEISDEKFEEKLFKKMELIELIPDEKHAKKGDVLLPNNLYLHQELTKRYLEPFTGYEAVLLDHEVGVGKTRSVIGTCENYLDNYKSKMVYFFSKNEKVKDNFMSEMQNMKLTKYFQKDESEYSRMSFKGFKISRTRSIKESYTFKTFETFAKDERMSNLEEIQIDISRLMRDGSTSASYALSEDELVDYQSILQNIENYVLEGGDRNDYIEDFMSEEDKVKLANYEEKIRSSKVMISEKEAEEKLTESQRNMLKTVRDEFRNSVIAIDEVHNIGVDYFNPFEKKELDESHKQYRRFWSLLKTVKDCHVILLSATPMVDSAVKMASILNLILPRTNQINYSEMKVKIETKNQTIIEDFLRPYMKGRISFLKQSSGVAKQNFMGEDFSFGKNLTSKIYLDYMEPTQASVYGKLSNKQSNEFGHDLRQVSNFAIVSLGGEKKSGKKSSKKSSEKEFEDEDFIDESELSQGNLKIDVEEVETEEKFKYINQTEFSSLLNTKTFSFVDTDYTKFYGNVKEMDDFKTFIKIDKLDEESKIFFLQQFFKKVTAKNYEDFIPKLKSKEEYFEKEIKPHDLLKSVMRPDLAVKNIRKSGIKVANVIYDILKNLSRPKEDQRCVFVYSHYKIYGAIIIAILMKILGFTKLDTSKESKTLTKCDFTSTPFRFATIIESKDSVEKIVKEFNNPENKYGDYLKVVIGSPQSSESISFFNVRTIHILEPGWNDQDTIQAIGRGVRSNSHQAFPPEKRFVDIFIHVSVIKKKNKKTPEETIDLHASHLSAEKAYKIKLVQNVARDCSYDKEFNAWRNGLPQKQFDEIDFSTYRVYYRKNFINFMIEKIQPMFFKRSYYTLVELSNETGFTTNDFISAMDQLKQYMIQNEFGISCYPHFDGKYIFLLPYRVSKTEFLAYYSQITDLQMDTNTSTFILNNNLHETYISKYVTKLNKFSNEEDVIKYLREYDVSRKNKKVPFGVSIYILESILKKDENKRTKNEKIFLNHFKWRWFVVRHDNKVKVIHTFYYISETHHFNCAKHSFTPRNSTEKKIHLRVLDENGWRFATEREEKQILVVVNETLNNEFKKYDTEENQYYGIICTTDGVLRLVNKLPLSNENKKVNKKLNCTKDDENQSDRRKNLRGVSIDSIVNKCSIFILFQMWVDLIEVLPHYDKIPFSDYNEFNSHFQEEFGSDDDKLKEKIIEIFEEFFTAKKIVWVY